MSKVILKVEIDEETYKQIKGDSMYDNNNKIIISKSSSAYNALNAIINATPITESDDAISCDMVIKAVDAHTNEDGTLDDDISIILEDLPPVLPKRKQGEWIEQSSNKEQGEREHIWWKCSQCGQVIFSETEIDRKEFHAFCSKCGAEMR